MKDLLKLLTLSFAFLMLQSCGEEDLFVLPTCENCEFDCIDIANDTPITNDCLDNHECTFTVHQNSKIDGSEPVSDPLKSGNKTVFKMFTDTEGSPVIADDEFTNVLVFEIDPKAENFEVEGSQLDGINLRFINLCFCSEVEYKKANSGCVQGQKIDDQFWQIQVNADFEYNSFTRTVVIDAVFEVE